MASLEALPAENGTLESFDDSEFSLIPEQPLEDGMANSHFDLGNSIPVQDASFMERLVDLVEDNKSMKEALKWNNVMMKEQLSTISEWHAQMTTSLSQQRISLEEAKAKIEELEKENEELRQIRENSSMSDKDADFEIVPSKEDDSLRVQLKEKDDLVEELRKEMDSLKLEISHLQSLSEAQNQEKAKLEEQLRDHETLKSRCDTLQIQAESFQGSLHLIRESEEQKIKKLQAALRESDERFVKEQYELEAERENHLQTKKLLRNLQDDYNRIDKLLQIQSKDEKEKSEHVMSERQQEKRKFLEDIDSLTAKLFDMEQQLEQKEEKIQRLSGELEAIQMDSESIPILKAQVDVLNTELTNEKETARKEIERLSLECNDLQTAVSFCASCGAGNAHADAMARGRGRKKNGSSRGSSQQEALKCPICNFGFKDLQGLQNHVNTCLDQTQ